MAAVDVQPGAFYHADVIRATINGFERERRPENQVSRT